MKEKIHTNVIVLGSGPSGYSAAFRCADLNLETILIERYTKLGGVCLNVGCIPSKALLYLSQVIEQARSINTSGIIFDSPKIDIIKIQLWKQKIIDKITNSLLKMSDLRKIKIINGMAKFVDSNTVIVESVSKTITIQFNHAIIATGSYPVKISSIPYKDHRIWDSTEALKLKIIPKNMLVIGAGAIGLEISTIYNTLGTKIDIIELSSKIFPSVDKDVTDFYYNQINNKFNFIFNAEISNVQSKDDGVYVTIKSHESQKIQRYDIILVAVGRMPNTKFINLDNIGIQLNNNGFIVTNQQMQTNIPHIYAIGDVVGHPMLAHKGSHEGHIAAEVISGLNHFFDTKIIPNIVYTEPNIAWVGMTEQEAKEKNIEYKIAIFPWKASGRAIASHFSDGITKLIFNKKTNRIIGGSVVGMNSGELLGEISLAIEMGCEAEDIVLTIHGHPTFYESINLAAQIYTGSITDLPKYKNTTN
uniref:Dihydrolipoyl dehydrogenase n=1 Tax=Candidatus Aschnera chinzeii TaxID=1485666 RepID=A0AAT9G4Z0_9ENTR|nr:MAG: dihydrolipoyl dehydrogenase [Candidatus Aschnera chinzeii]